MTSNITIERYPLPTGWNPEGDGWYVVNQSEGLTTWQRRVVDGEPEVVVEKVEQGSSS